MSQDVDAYYRQMAFNYKEAAGKGEDGCRSRSKTRRRCSPRRVISRNLKRSPAQLSRVKAWEEKCEKEAKRFEKAAEWTEAHFHLEKPKIPDKPPGSEALEDTVGLAGVGSQESLSKIDRVHDGVAAAFPTAGAIRGNRIHATMCHGQWPDPSIVRKLKIA